MGLNVYKPEGMGKLWDWNIKGNSNFLEDAIKRGSILEARVLKCDKDLTLYVDLGDTFIGIIPLEEYELKLDGKETKNIAVASRVGKTVKFKVIEITEDTYEGKKNVVLLSRRDAQIECMDNYINKLRCGDIIDARLYRVWKYGVFCDVGSGIIGLLPIKNISVSRISCIETRFKDITDLKVVVHSVDDKGRLTLSHKELLGTWEEEASNFNKEDVVIGVIRVIEDYGAFIELTPNLSGLADVSRSNRKLKVGDRIAVCIDDIIPGQMKVKLSIVNGEILDKQRDFTGFKYKVTEGRLRNWMYSPEAATRKIETVFYR